MMKFLLFLMVALDGYKVSERNCRKCHRLEVNRSVRTSSKIIRGCKMIKSTCHLIYECSVYNNCGIFHVRSRKNATEQPKLSYNHLVRKILADPYQKISHDILISSFRWGEKPTRNRSSKTFVTWKLCPFPLLTKGVDKLACDGATCIPICRNGYKAAGKQRKMNCKRNKEGKNQWSKSIGCLTKENYNNPLA